MFLLFLVTVAVELPDDREPSRRIRQHRAAAGEMGLFLYAEYTEKIRFEHSVLLQKHCSQVQDYIIMFVLETLKIKL